MFTHAIRVVVLMTFLVGALSAAMVQVNVATTIDNKGFSGKIVFDGSSNEKRPGIVMIPNWMGPTPASQEKAEMIAAMGYVVYMADMYGHDIRPTNMEEASAAATTVRSDRAMMRKRAAHHVEVLKGYAKTLPIDAEHIAALGFCFGGGTVLELARSGADIAAVISFHGNLDTPNAADAAQIKCPVLVLHGAIDPFVPPEQVAAFHKEMQDAKVDYQFIAYGHAVHSFTDPNAAMAGKAEYHEQSAKRSFIAMKNQLDEVFAK